MLTPYRRGACFCICLSVCMFVCLPLPVDALVPKQPDQYQRNSGVEVGQGFTSVIFVFLEKLILMMSQQPFCKINNPALSRPQSK